MLSLALGTFGTAMLGPAWSLCASSVSDSLEPLGVRATQTPARPSRRVLVFPKSAVSRMCR